MQRSDSTGAAEQNQPPLPGRLLVGLLTGPAQTRGVATALVDQENADHHRARTQRAEWTAALHTRGPCESWVEIVCGRSAAQADHRKQTATPACGSSSRPRLERRSQRTRHMP